MGFFILLPGYFIQLFIWIAGIFHEYFIAIKYPKKGSFNHQKSLRILRMEQSEHPYIFNIAT